MTILTPDHLIDQAARLVVSPRPGPVRQVDLRRAISSSYYGVFHAALIAAADSIVGRVHRRSVRYARVYRSIEHKDLRTICDLARRPTLPPMYQPHVPGGGFGGPIKSFAEGTVWLQERRLAADYDPLLTFVAKDAETAINIARSAVRSWRTSPPEQREALIWLMMFRPRV